MNSVFLLLNWPRLKKPSLSYYSLIVGKRSDGFIPVPNNFVMVTDFIPYNNKNTECTFWGNLIKFQTDLLNTNKKNINGLVNWFFINLTFDFTSTRASQKFCNILVGVSLQNLYCVSKTDEDICCVWKYYDCALFHCVCVCDLKAPQKNEKHSLIWEIYAL